MVIFKGQNLLESAERFTTDENGKEYMANIKWNYGFICNHTGSQTLRGFS
jgi:hypothetical protein